MVDPLLTISQLAKSFDISRSTILYYENSGVLSPASRSSNGYRWYGSKEKAKLELIINYRSFGLSITHIKELLERTQSNHQRNILSQQFNQIELEIKKLKQQQLAIVKFLDAPELLSQKNITKEEWAEIMQSSGMDERAMRNWHCQFEKLKPDAHQEFLSSLQIPREEIKQIRAWSSE